MCVAALLCCVDLVVPGRAGVAEDFKSVSYHVIGLAINVFAVSVPGRFDSDADPASMNFPWPTLFAPAGFAFAIWGVVYVGELLGLVALCLADDALAKAAARSSRAWLCANVAQALWCAAFRPWALDRLWLSSLCLGATAVCLVASQLALVTLDGPAAGYPTRAPLKWALITYPRSLHAGWATAAALVNVNAWTGKLALGPPTALAVTILSLVCAVALADFYARSGLGCATAAVAWALLAVSKGAPTGADAAALGPVALEGLAMATLACAGMAATAAVVRGAWA